MLERLHGTQNWIYRENSLLKPPGKKGSAFLLNELASRLTPYNLCMLAYSKASKVFLFYIKFLLSDFILLNGYKNIAVSKLNKGVKTKNLP